MSDILVKDLEALGEKMAVLRDEIADAKAAVSVKENEYDELERKAISMLGELGKKSYPTEAGLITKVEHWKVKLPQTPEDRKQFFDYLKEKGIFDNLITVNSNTLNSFFKAEWEALKQSSPEEAMNFRIPGINEPTLHETISFRRK